VGGPFPDNEFTYVSRWTCSGFSTLSLAQGVGVIDWTANTTDKYFFR